MTNQNQNLFPYPPLMLEQFQGLREFEQMDLCCFYIKENGALLFDADNFIMSLLGDTFNDLSMAIGLALTESFNHPRSTSKGVSQSVVLRLRVKNGSYSIVYDAPTFAFAPINKKVIQNINALLEITSKKFNDMMNLYAISCDEKNWRNFEFIFTWHEQGGFKYDTFVRQSNKLETINEQKYESQDALKSGLIDDVIKHLDEGKEKGHLVGLSDGSVVITSVIATEDFKIIDVMYQIMPSHMV